MGEWTWLHARFPVADMELVQPPMDVRVANVIVRTIRAVPTPPGDELRFLVRVAPHNVAPFRGGPWLREFSEQELERPGEALVTFREALAEAIERAMTPNTSTDP